jgi:hypothetical protein
MTNTIHPKERYLRDIKISASVALAFVLVLLLLFFVNAKTGILERLVTFFVTKLYGSAS